MSAQLSNASGFTGNGKDSIRANVPHLLRLRFPAAIFFAVIAIIVYATNACSRWTLPHVSDESRKTFPPRRTNLNSPSAVIVEIGTIRITATLNDVFPCAVKGMLTATPRVSMFDSRFRPLRRTLSLDAFTGRDISVFEMGIADGRGISAFAQAKRMATIALGRGRPNNFQLAEHSPDGNYFSRHCIVPFFNALFSGERGSQAATRHDFAINPKGVNTYG